MEANHHAARSRQLPASSPPDAGPASPADHQSEDLFVRNYDVARSYTLRLTADHVHADRQVRRRYTLQPGQVVAESGVLPEGAHDVTVEIAHAGAESRCEIGPAPAQTALVEVGNGTVTVSQGLY